MGKLRDVTTTVVGRAKANAARVRREGGAVATRLSGRATELASRPAVNEAVRQAKKTVARARAQASAIAAKATAPLTARARKRKRTRVALAVAGAATAATAVGVVLARRRKR